MDLYTQTEVTDAVKRIEDKNTGLLGLVFKRQATHLTETITTDIDENIPEVAPLISDVEEGVVLKDKGYVSKVLTPAFTRVKKEVNRAKVLARMAGQKLGDATDNTEVLKAAALKQAKDSIIQRLKVMATQALFDGAISYQDEAGRKYNVDFNRKATLSTTLTGSDAWSDENANPIENLEDWADGIRQESGSDANAVIFDPKAWSLARKNKFVKEALDTRRGSGSELETACATVGNVRHVGTLGTLEVLVYSEQYVENGVSKPMLKENSALLLNTEDVLGVQHFGSLMTKEGLVETDFLAKEIYDEEVSKLWEIVESRPLLVPHRINATFAATVA